MKQVLQSLRDGSTLIADVPTPLPRPGHLLIQTHASLISAGSERTLIEFGKASWLNKARSQPEKVMQVLDKIRADGLAPTLEAVFSKLNEPMPVGYCNCGTVLAVGDGVTGFAEGDLVVSNGNHAEIVSVPRTLCARVPEGVSADEAAFTVLASVALQGIRLVEPTLGERFMVYGLGLIGLITVQLLRANGCDVLGVDIDPKRLALAESFGARVVDGARGGDAVATARAWTDGQGVDGVLITASAAGDHIVHHSAEACRKRGRIVLVGVVGLNLRRSDFYAKELRFQVSCSYGPGRYDPSYENEGRDYPLAYVRWTEQRNFDAVLGMIARGALNVAPLIAARYPLVEAADAYARVSEDTSALGILLTYPAEVERSPVVETEIPSPSTASGQDGAPRVAVIGAGAFAKMVMLPALGKTRARVAAVASRTGTSASYLAKKFGAERAISDHRIALEDPAIDAVLISIQHGQHAKMVCEALAAGKHVFVEKPLCIRRKELLEIEEALAAGPDRLLMVGFNRRYSAHTQKIIELLAERAEPLAMTMTVNAGDIPYEHWVHDPDAGGGRVIGEGCHFIDLMCAVADAPVTNVSAMMIGPGPAVRDDKMVISLAFADGSIGTINYFANGTKKYPKETLEVFSDGRVLRLENFRQTRGFGFRGFRTFKTRRQDKGHAREFARFVALVADGGSAPQTFDAVVNVTRASFAAVESAATGRLVSVPG
jgi:predicted dehydrogenase/NADPH:quinone reductase-like Zn-dependent oxidoreductase